jgi:dihydroorotase (multifunctional complex type)
MAGATVCISDAIIVSDADMRPGSVLVEGERIAAILDKYDRPAADISIDAKGRLLFPGFIDTHVHFRDPGLTYKEDFASGSEAAACGGVTTVMCMPNTKPPIATREAFEMARAAGEAKSHVDFCLQGSITSENLQAVPPLWGVGVSSFEINLSDGAEGASVERIDDHGLLLDIMRLTADVRAPLGMYTGSQGITTHEIKRLRDDLRRRDVRAHAEARPPIAEVVGIAAALELALEADARVVFREVTTARGLELLRRGKRDFAPGQVTVEVTPHHMLVTADTLDRLGTAAQIVPPLRHEMHRAATVAAVRDGTVDIVGSDHAPHAESEKIEDPWTSRNGTPGLESAAAVLLHFVHQGVLTYPDVCRLFSGAPAAAFGLSGRKGGISPGADADLVLVDPRMKRAVGTGMMKSKMKRSALDGLELTGWPVLTMLRGAIIMKDGHMGAAPSGRFIAGPGIKGR